MTGCEDWGNLCEKAQRVVDEQMFLHEQDRERGLRDNQRVIVQHILKTLAGSPGMIVAERTGIGKSLIAMAIMGALARVRAEVGAAPLRVGLLAPNQDVLANWVRSRRPESNETCLLSNAFEEPTHPTYLWKTDRLPWSVVCPRHGIYGLDKTACLQIFADHYSRGITNGYGTWGKNVAKTRARAKEFVDGGSLEPLDLLIIDEAHQLKSSGSNRAEAIHRIFGEKSPVLPVRRVLLMTATPFQLRAAPELARLISIVRWPRAMGVDFPDEFLTSTNPQALASLFDRYQLAVARWLAQRMANDSADQTQADALKVKGAVEELLRKVIVRTNTSVGSVVTRYGQSDPHHKLAKPMPDPAAGLSCETVAERLLFLAWDGSIAARTTFVAAEQQTLTSSVRALTSSQDRQGEFSAAEKNRRPLAPKKINEALFGLSRALGKYVRPDHVKVRATVEAIRSRLEQQTARRPVLVFAERTATLDLLREELRSVLPEHARVEVIYGNTSREERGKLVEEFNRSDVHILLVSKVAEMGLDIDGPPDSEDIWLIHHDFPWNPAMVEQRNGRVTRWGKGDPDDQRKAYITYPFIRDTVDERIFKRMLARQAIAECLLGTDEVARALRLADQSNLDDLEIGNSSKEEFRSLTPDLSPQFRDSPDTARAASLAPETVPSARHMDRTIPPSWCPLELLDVSEQQASAKMSNKLRDRVQAMAEDLGVQSWSSSAAELLRIDLVGRFQTVAILQQQDRVVCLSLADTSIDDARILKAFALNSEPGVAGLLLVRGSSGDERLIARAANLTETLDDRELRRLLVETGRRADEWEINYYGEDRDQW